MDVEERPGRRRRRVIALCVTVALAAGGAALAALRPWEHAGPEAAEAGEPKPTVAVARETLVDETSVPGRLDYGPDSPLAVPGLGMITWMAAEGANVGRGDPLLRVNEIPVLAMFGSVPMFRPLTTETVGRDVKQLETNLRDLGYGGFTVDEEFTDRTAEAVERWQLSLGMPGTGVVMPGQIIFVPGPIRVTRQLVRPGGMMTGTDALSYTSQNKSVTVETDIGKADWAEAGRAVTIGLPDGKSVAGQVQKVVTEAAATVPGAADTATGQKPTVRVQVKIDNPKAVRDYTPSAVDVRYVAEERKDVLTVPVAALLALSEGGYGIEVVDAVATRVVPIEVGMFTDARVEISGPGLDEGVLVSIAS